MNAYVGVTGQKIANGLGFMSAQIIANDVHGLLLGQAGQELFQKGHELRTGVPGRGAANDFAVGGIQCAVERKRTVPIVLKTVALGPAQGSRAAPDPSGPVPGSRSFRLHRRLRHGAEASDKDR